jgi:sugar lactone lactonase YvrE
MFPRLFFAFLIIVGCSHKRPVSEDAPRAPKVVFTITEGIAHPESVIYSEVEDAIFVSNVVSGNPTETKRVGTITKYSPSGELLAAPWVKGLKAPKGMAIVENHLYVSDVDQMVKIDLKSGKVIQTITIPGAKFLNDVTADEHGNVYVSDMGTDTIHVWDRRGVRTWLKTPQLRSPNGILAQGSEHLLLVSWGNPINPRDFSTENPGSLSALSFKQPSEKIVEQETPRGNLDGITLDNDGNLWVSDWMNGDVWMVTKQGEAKRVYNFGKGTADIFYAKKLKLLLVPQMNESKVLAITL